MMCDSQDLALHSVMSDGVATVSQTLGWGAKRLRKLMQTPVNDSYRPKESVAKRTWARDCDVLLQLGMPKRSEGFLLGLRSEDAVIGEVFGLWIGGPANALGSAQEIIMGVAKLNVGAEQEPVGSRLTKRHSHAP